MKTGWQDDVESPVGHTINMLVRSLLAMTLPAARLSGSLVHNQDSMPKSSVDPVPFKVIHFSGKENE